MLAAGRNSIPKKIPTKSLDSVTERLTENYIHENYWLDEHLILLTVVPAVKRALSWASAI